MSRVTKYQTVKLETTRPKDAKSPLETENFLSRWLYLWADPLMKLGNERQLEASDLWPLPSHSKCEVITESFEPKFNESKSIFWASMAVFGTQALVVGVLQFIAMVLSLYGPIVLNKVVSSIEMSSPDFQTLAVPVVTLFAVKIVQAILQTQTDLKNELLFVKVMAVLQNLLYKKALRLNAKSRKAKSTGEVSNLFTSDMWPVVAVSFFINQVWIIPLQVTALMYLLWQQLDWAMFSGIGVMVVAFFLTRWFATMQRTNWRVLMGKKDTRMKTINEVFGSMQIIKLNAWEERYYTKICDLRADELRSLWTQFCIGAGTTAMNNIAPVALTTISFACYVLLLKQTLTASKVFTALSLFNMVKQPMMRLPQIVAAFMQAHVSYKRFSEFLALDERDPTVVTSEVSANSIDIEVVDGSFGWDAEKPFFTNLNLTVKRGEFVVVHGSVGEGKTSLCNVLLGELDKYNGKVGVNGRIAYFAQQPWIQNMTIRENILFGLPYDRVKYNRVLEACALGTDLTLFAAGDRTEIGSKGVNVSGGQKARISLARACYSDADIFILDSPLSAVDAIVQNEIFTKCFLGLLRNKTIVLVTHSPEIIASPYVDRTIEVSNGGNLLETINTDKQDFDILIPPYPARANISTEDMADELDAIDAEGRPGSSLQYLDVLVSPSLKSPFGATVEDHLFTPFDASAPQTYNEEETRGKLVVTEERESGRVSQEVFLAYFNAVGGWTTVILLLLVQSLWQGLQVSSDLWLSSWTATGATLTTDEFQATAEYNISVYAALAIGSSVMVVVRVLTVSFAGIRASKKMFDDMTKALLGAPMRFFDTNPLGRILNRFSGDINAVDGRLPNQFGFFLSTVFVLLFSLGTTIVVIKTLGLVLLPLMFIYYKIASVYVQPAREMERLNKTTRSPLITHISESIDGAIVVRAFGGKQVRRFERLQQNKVNRNMETMFCGELASQWFSFRIQMISAFMLLVTTMSLIYMRSYLNAGLVGLVFGYSLQITGQLEWMVQMWSQLETAMVAPERVAEYTNVVQEAPRVISGAVPASWPEDGSIAFNNVSFRYKPNDPLVLKDVNFSIKSGEKVGIVGRTGAGKSSLTMALFRINEIASGSVVIGGVNTSTVGVKTLRESMAIIPQNPILFKGTLRSYLDPFDQYTDAQLWDALEKVKLTPRIAQEEKKLESTIEENGENYSVGERQMLCMARALLRNCHIVVMDEATAAIDHETDQNLQRVIREEFASSTVLTIAHRLDTVLDADRIMVFDQGRVAQCDTPEALIAAGTGIFFELCNEGGYLDKVHASTASSTSPREDESIAEE
ncbi:hypothetical protein H310_12538 [Aphanomyces invadans]|uniref:Multidrug resistance-associated protein 1 n=1 Tax=Aphanomyces invadans TaxID=157072 RepID=A0A024THN8_9STRA|nr:hypothetical protein H310_12538 [Aphanomyces invadans]ETV93494.1 hypothetical protein H310_12538 [Aphanomyces invadans]|eukprot:XP_008877836.1 hypothetical protein H310_12538 [Aphanomyces invadans]